jgi:hypothetical protein
MYRDSLTSGRRVLVVLGVIALITILFFSLYRVARHVVLNEIRFQAMGVAIATAAGIDPADLADLRTPDDAARESFVRIQQQISSISTYNPDVRYVYLMRRAEGPDAKPTDYSFIIDQSSSDDNRNGTIDPDEVSEPIGTIYDAADLPHMVQAWTEPSADQEPSPDPPYPDLLSGYAPIRDTNGVTVAIVGADVTAGTVGEKLLILRIVAGLVWLVMLGMVTITLMLYFAQRDLVHERGQLIGELRAALDSVNTLSGLLPICSSCKKIRDDVGHWERLEVFMGKRSRAEFSHSICPDCSARLYPEANA